MTNRPVNFNDPTGHRPCGDGEEYDCNGNSQNPNEDPYTDVEVITPDTDPDINLPDPDSVLGNNTGDLNGYLCSAQILSGSTCQTINGLVGVGVLVLDGISFIGSGIFAILETVAFLGGPIGIGAVEAAYLIGNVAEGWAGVTSFALTLLNDVLIAGGTYMTLGSGPELVISSDVVVSFIFAVAGGIDPEPYGDTLINGAAVVHDFYRLTGGDALFSLHIGFSGWYLTE